MLFAVIVWQLLICSSQGELSVLCSIVLFKGINLFLYDLAKFALNNSSSNNNNKSKASPFLTLSLSRERGVA